MPEQKSSKSDFEKPGRQIAHCNIPIYEMLQDQLYESKRGKTIQVS